MSQDWESFSLVAHQIAGFIIEILKYYNITKLYNDLLQYYRELFCLLSLIFPMLRMSPEGLSKNLVGFQSRKKACHSSAGECKVWAGENLTHLPYLWLFEWPPIWCREPVLLLRDPPVCQVREKVSLCNIILNARTGCFVNAAIPLALCRSATAEGLWLCSRAGLVDSTVGCRETVW